MVFNQLTILFIVVPKYFAVPGSLLHWHDDNASNKRSSFKWPLRKVEFDVTGDPS